MNNKLIICACRNRGFVSQSSIDRLVEEATGEGRDVEVVDDLCALVETADETDMVRLRGAAVAACRERAVRSLLAWDGVEAAELTDIRTLEGNRGPGDDAWYPVIDKDRCTECGKCHDYCPFGVYEMVDDRVRVVHPSHCKNNCPSCARNCPSEAIIFPKYERSPINGGIERQERLVGDAPTVASVAAAPDTSVLYAEAFRARLMERRQIGKKLFDNKS